MKRTIRILNAFLLALLLTSCSDRKDGASLSCDDFSIRNFSTGSDSVITLLLDYDHANSGFVIPSIKQDNDGLNIHFELKNNTSGELYYKLFYQNESYKFPEYDSLQKKEEPLSAENFYGSWENTSEAFKKIDRKSVV